MELDKKDFALLDALQQDASRRLEDLAKMVQLAPSSVHDRLRRLQRAGLIQSWTIKVDAAALGLGVLAYVAIATTRSCIEMWQDFEGIAGIEECHSIAGEFCVLLKVRVAGTSELLDVIDRVKHVAGVERTETTIVLKTQFERPAALNLLLNGKNGRG
jgi:DNA-binding Lrp family transcriptional regulator